MKAAIVTGSTSGIGEEICNRLLDLGYRVYGLARRHTEKREGNLTRICCDLTDLRSLAKVADRLSKSDKSISVLVNNAGFGIFDPHEEIPLSRLIDMLTTNFAAPIILSRCLLRLLKRNQGHIINIGSVAGTQSGHRGAAYAATKAGLHHFGRCLFEETRKHGLKITTILPDLTLSPFYDHLYFEPDADPQAHLTPEQVAQAVVTALTTSAPGVITTLEIRPQLNKIKRKKSQRKVNP